MDFILTDTLKYAWISLEPDLVCAFCIKTDVDASKTHFLMQRLKFVVTVVDKYRLTCTANAESCVHFLYNELENLSVEVRVMEGCVTYLAFI